MAHAPFEGVLVPALTPYADDLSVDTGRFVDHCKWLLDQGANGLAVFGTTSEANSLTVGEKLDLLDALTDAGVPAAKLMPGTGACAIGDAVTLTRRAVEFGCGGVLMLPPFYYKGVSDDGLFAAFSEVIERTGSDGLKVYLYHIPPVSQVPIALELIERLLKAYPDTVVGLKDSSGDWSNTDAVLTAFPGFGVFAGSEVFLLDTLRGGGAGCITATGNVNPAGIREVYENWRTGRADALQARITEVRTAIQAYAAIPSMKRMIEEATGMSGWSRMRPPLVALDDAIWAKFDADMKAIDFALDMGQATVDA